MMRSKSPQIKVDPGTDIPVLKCGIREDVLRFKTTVYDRLMLAPYVQKDEYKVTLQVSMKNLPLETEVEKEIFHQIVGTRKTMKGTT